MPRSNINLFIFKYSISIHTYCGLIPLILSSTKTKLGNTRVISHMSIFLVGEGELLKFIILIPSYKLYAIIVKYTTPLTTKI